MFMSMVVKSQNGVVSLISACGSGCYAGVVCVFSYGSLSDGYGFDGECVCLH